MVLGNEYLFNSYVWQQLPNAEIGWQNDFDGTQSVEIEDNNNLVKDVSVDSHVDGTTTVLTFKFTPTESFDVSHLMVKMWDQNRSYWVNNFHDALEIKSNPLIEKNVGAGMLPTASEIHEISSETDEVSELETHEDEHEFHGTTEEITCNADKVAVLDSRFHNSYCVSSNIATALIESGLASTI